VISVSNKVMARSRSIPRKSCRSAENPGWSASPNTASQEALQVVVGTDQAGVSPAACGNPTLLLRDALLVARAVSAIAAIDIRPGGFK
jgi:hypothetical protein